MTESTRHKIAIGCWTATTLSLIGMLAFLYWTANRPFVPYQDNHEEIFYALMAIFFTTPMLGILCWTGDLFRMFRYAQKHPWMFAAMLTACVLAIALFFLSIAAFFIFVIFAPAMLKVAGQVKYG